MRSFCVSLGEVQAGLAATELKRAERQPLEHGCNLQGMNLPGDMGGARPAALLGGLCVSEQLLRASTLCWYFHIGASPWERSSHQREVRNGVGPQLLFVFVQALHGFCLSWSLWPVSWLSGPRGQTWTSCQLKNTDIIYLMLKPDIAWGTQLFTWTASKI